MNIAGSVLEKTNQTKTAVTAVEATKWTIFLLLVVALAMLYFFAEPCFPHLHMGIYINQLEQLPPMKRVNAVLRSLDKITDFFLVLSFLATVPSHAIAENVSEIITAESFEATTPRTTTPAQQDNVHKEIVAEINDVKIIRGELDQMVREQYPLGAGALENAQLHALQSKVLKTLVERELIYQAALASFRNNNSNVNPSDGKFTQVERDRIVNDYLNTHVYQKISISNSDLQTAYDANPERYSPPREIHLWHIFIQRPKRSDFGLVADTEHKTQQILAEVQSKKRDFGDIAKHYSDAPSRANSGDMGFVTANQLEPAVAEVAFALEIGAVSDIIRTVTGYHIIKVEEKRNFSTLPFEQLKDKINAALLRQAKQEALANKLAELRRHAKTIVYLK